jgi:hypothetical protein
MMGIILTEQLVAWRIVIACFAAAGLAQVLKTLAGLRKRGKLDWKVALESGGMPSSHAAAVSALATAMFAETGFTPLSVAVLVFSLIVIRDAVGVRWVTAQQSVAINRIIKSLREERKLRLDYLKEAIGHTPAQVLAGVALGIAVAIAVEWVM